MEYFEDQKPPAQGGFCADEECPCGHTTFIPVGEGYLYISQSCCDLRRNYRSLAQFRAMMEQWAARNGYLGVVGVGVGGSIPMCETGARRRNLDLAVAATDAMHWWATAQVPLRPTPLRRERADRFSEAEAAPWREASAQSSLNDGKASAAPPRAEKVTARSAAERSSSIERRASKKRSIFDRVVTGFLFLLAVGATLMMIATVPQHPIGGIAGAVGFAL